MSNLSDLALRQSRTESGSSEGSIDVTAEGKSHVLGAGQLLYLSGGVTHGVVALEDASALVTIALGK